MIQIEIAWIDTDDQAQLATLTVPAEGCLLEALTQWDATVGWMAEFDQGHVAVWGARAQPETVYQKNTRIEWLVPLRCDPKQARLRRLAKSS